MERGRAMNHVRKYFAGGNSSVGFYSLYHHIIADDANRIFILKGGPGTGKSTFMRKIGEQLLAQGYEIEEFHCSSDANSLDAVTIPELKVGLIDGTAPHVVDPKYPGCVDEIIHLGDFWELEALEANKGQIIELTRDNSACYKRAYRYLRAAKAIYEDIEAINGACMDFGYANQIGANIINELFKGVAVHSQPGTVRHLFASAITPQGPVNELPSIMDPMKDKYILKGEPGIGKSRICQKVVNAAIERGFSVEAFHCPLDPEKIEHVVIPELSVGIITSYPPHLYEDKEATIINLNDYLDHTKRGNYRKLLHKDTVSYEELLDRAFDQLRQAKAIHDHLEVYYVEHMDFDKMNDLRQGIVERILTYAK